MTDKFEDICSGLVNMDEENIRKQIRKNKQERVVTKTRNMRVSKDNRMEKFLGALERLTPEQKKELLASLGKEKK